MNRRSFLKAVPAAVLAMPRFRTNPFGLGVASGEPTKHSVVLWTRLTPSPMEPDGGLAPEPLAVRWQLASDERMQGIVREGVVFARPELAHSVHVDAQGLRPGREYWYRFITGNEESPIARTKTLPSDDELSFAHASCQHYEQGYYVAYECMVRDDPDFVLHLGDYIYDVSFGDTFRKHESDEPPQTLEAYRLRYALYKSDALLQHAHASLPFVAVPDNHDALEFNDPAKYRRRAAAFQAWYEHMPIRARHRPDSASLALYQSIDIGELARIYVLDTRQFRDDQEVCRDGADPSFGFGIYRPKCKALDAPSRTMLGVEQESWLTARMQSSSALWNVVATTVPFAPFEFLRKGRRYVYYGGWSAYPANRERILRSIDEMGLPNPVFVSGDVHSSWVNDVEWGGHKVATELTTTSISSDWPPPLADPVTENLPNNPHVKFYEPTKRGYCLNRLTRESWTTRMRAVDSVKRLDAEASDLKRVELEPSGKGKGG